MISLENKALVESLIIKKQIQSRPGSEVFEDIKDYERCRNIFREPQKILEKIADKAIKKNGH